MPIRKVAQDRLFYNDGEERYAQKLGFIADLGQHKKAEHMRDSGIALKT